MTIPAVGRTSATTTLVPGQLDLVYVDQAGTVHHAWFAYLEARPTWHVERLGLSVGLPLAPVDGPLGFDGAFHYFMPGAAGGVFHLWWDRRTWAHDLIDVLPTGAPQ